MLYRWGVESTSTSPFKRARFSPETIGDPDMGVAAEYVAERYNITREMKTSMLASVTDEHCKH